MEMTDWSWLAKFDPVTVEHERFNVDLDVLRARERVDRGIIPPPVDHARERFDWALLKRSNLHATNAGLRKRLRRERESHARERAWFQKLLNGHLGGRFSLEER